MESWEWLNEHLSTGTLAIVFLMTIMPEADNMLRQLGWRMAEGGEDEKKNGALQPSPSWSAGLQHSLSVVENVSLNLSNVTSWAPDKSHTVRKIKLSVMCILYELSPSKVNTMKQNKCLFPGSRRGNVFVRRRKIFLPLCSPKYDDKMCAMFHIMGLVVSNGSNK